MSGFKHFTDCRYFHFARHDFTEHSVTKTVGICKFKPDACSPVWGDTQLHAGVLALNVYIDLPIVSFIMIISLCCFCSVVPGAIVPLMKDPLQVLNYDSWWRNDLSNILPYVIPAVNDDITQTMEVQLGRLL